MTFNIVAMICVAGMSPVDCGPEPGFSRDVAIIGSVSNELWCGVEAQQDLARARRSETWRKANSSKSCASETADCTWELHRIARKTARPLTRAI